MTNVRHNWLNGIVQDVRYGVRTFRRNPGFTVTALAMLAMGIGVNAMIFTVTNAVLFNGFPLVERNDRIVYITTGVGCCVSYPDFDDWRTHAKSFSGMAIVRGVDKPVGDDADFPQRRTITEVSAGTFRLVGQNPLLGRDFLPSDERVGATPVAILRYEFWERQYGKDPDMVGRTIRIAGTPTTVIGVMPRGFAFPQNGVLWVPLVPTGEVMRRENRAGGWFAFGRLTADATIQSARAEMELIGRQLGSAYPETNQGRNLVPHLYNFREFFIGRNATMIYQAMLGAVSFVLLIACANLANLLLARAVTRSREISVRIALGAGRWRIVRQLLVESAMLSAVGGLCGWLVANAGLRIYTRWASGPSISDAINSTWFDGMLDYTMDSRVFLYLVLISITTGVLFGLAPALKLARLDMNNAMKDGSRGSTSGKRSKYLSGLLLVVEIVLAIVLLGGAGVMIRSFLKIYMADMGVETDNLLVTRVVLPSARYPGLESQIAFVDRLNSRVEALPGVQAVTMANALPTERLRRASYEIDDSRATMAEQARPTVSTMNVGPEYFSTLGARVLAGREFSVVDGAAAPRVAVVNERFAATIWPYQSAIGKRLRLFSKESSDWLTVVGVVTNIAQNDTTRQTIDPIVYLPFRQVASGAVAIFAKTSGDPNTLTNVIRREVQAIDPELFPLPRPLADILGQSYQYRAITGAMFLVCATIALLLASIGLYAVMMHSVIQRTQEIGVRMAIGATAADIRHLVFKQGFMTLGIGLPIGIAASVLINRLLVLSLVQVSPMDPTTYIAVCALLVVCTMLGCWIPARRAMRLNPVIALQPQ